MSKASITDLYPLRVKWIYGKAAFSQRQGLGPSQPMGRICEETFCCFLGAVGLSTRGKALRVRLAPELNVEKDEMKEASPGSSQKFLRSGHA